MISLTRCCGVGRAQGLATSRAGGRSCICQMVLRCRGHRIDLEQMWTECCPGWQNGIRCRARFRSISTTCRTGDAGWRLTAGLELQKPDRRILPGRPVSDVLAARSTSARVIVPSGPRGCTRLRSTSSLRASARTVGGPTWCGAARQPFAALSDWVRVDLPTTVPVSALGPSANGCQRRTEPNRETLRRACL